MSGLIVLAVVLAATSAAGFALRLRQGRFRVHRSPSGVFRTGRADSRQATAADTALTAADLGASLGERATLVQFSTEFCTYCGPTRELLAEVARAGGGRRRPRRGRCSVKWGRVTAAPLVNSIWGVSSRTAQMLTKRRAVDFCRVATAICRPPALAAA